MNKIERFAYNLVRTNPILKNRIRNIYQSIFDLLPLGAAQSSYSIVERAGYFYGFHDHSPFSHDNSKLLANKAAFDLRMPKLGDALTVGFFEGKDHQNFIELAKTNAWCWHMGCKLQWVGQTNKVIFNDHIGGKNICMIADQQTEGIGRRGNEWISPKGNIYLSFLLIF